MNNSFNNEDELPHSGLESSYEQLANVSSRNQTDRDAARQPVTQSDHQHQYRTPTALHLGHHPPNTLHPPAPPHYTHQFPQFPNTEQPTTQLDYQHQYGTPIATQQGHPSLFNTPHVPPLHYVHQFLRSLSTQGVPNHMPRPTGQAFNHGTFNQYVRWGLPGPIAGRPPQLGEMGMLVSDDYGSASGPAPSQSLMTNSRPLVLQFEPSHPVHYSRHAYPEMQQGPYHDDKGPAAFQDNLINNLIIKLPSDSMVHLRALTSTLLLTD